MSAAISMPPRPGPSGSKPPAPPAVAPTDDVLLTAARAGDLRAWEMLVRRHQGFAFRYAYLTTRDATVAEDATKLAFVRAYRTLPSWQAETEFRPWLMRIVAGVSRSKKREAGEKQDRRYVEPEHSPRLPADLFGPSGALPPLTPLEREALVAAFDRLGTDEREIVASRYVLGLTRREIVAYLGTSGEEVDERLRRALARLRAYLADG